MENIAFKCINNKTCSYVCNAKTCKAIPFMCNDEQCSCQSYHQKFTTHIRWNIMRQVFTNKRKKSSPQLISYFKQVNELYKNVINQIEKSFTQIKIIFENFGLSQLERQVYEKLKYYKIGELTGELINKVETELMQDKKQYQFRIIEQQKKQIEKQTKILVEILEGLTNLNVKEEKRIFNAPIDESQILFKLDSKITQDIVTLSSFFINKKIVGMNLLYRASQNNFQASKFHDMCDGRKHSITILKTQFGNVIGGYTPIPWNKSKYTQQQIDSCMQPFIFSLTNKHKLVLIKGKQEDAIEQQYE